MAAWVEYTGGLYAGTSRAVSSSRVGVGVYDITFDRNVQNCVAVGSAYYIVEYRVSTSTFVSGKLNTARAFVSTAGGDVVDGDFYLTVTC